MTMAMPLHPVQWLHLWNALVGFTLTAVLIGVSANIRSFVNQGAELAGFGNYNVFAYPATYVFMLIPAVCSLVYSLILAVDMSPAYRCWRPSQVLRGTVASFAGALLLAALLPILPGADVITSPDMALACTWRDYMAWRTIYNNPDVFPWVLDMDQACGCFQAADGLCWVLGLGWLAVLGLYTRIVRKSPPVVKTDNAWPLDTVAKTDSLP